MKMLNRGVLIALEGIDGSGKTTLAHNIFNALSAKFCAILTKEPGATALGQHLRTILQEKNVSVCSQAEFLLFAADRAQHFHEIIKPQLAQKKLIISDRLADSSLAYQGFGRGLDNNVINYINQWAMQSIKPDLTLYIRIDLATSSARVVQRNNALTSFEQEKKEFLQKIIDGFETLYAHRNDVIILDGQESSETLTQQASDVIMQWLNNNTIYE